MINRTFADMSKKIKTPIVKAQMEESKAVEVRGTDESEDGGLLVGVVVDDASPTPHQTSSADAPPGTTAGPRKTTLT